MKVGSLVEKIPNEIAPSNNQKLVSELAKSYGSVFPVNGEVYTIRAFCEKTGGVLLEEIINPLIPGYNFDDGIAWEISFHPRLFREVQPPMDVDISEVQFYQVPKKDFACR